MHILSGYLRSAVMWAMVLLTLVGARPVTGCTCADGQYKPVCFAQFQGFGETGTRSQTGTHSANQPACEKGCCKACTAGSGESSCCKQGLCSTTDTYVNSNGKKCCSPDLPTAVAVGPTANFAVDLMHHFLFDLPPISPVDTIVHASAVEHFVPLDSGPGDDLIVTLRRLLI